MAKHPHQNETKVEDKINETASEVVQEKNELVASEVATEETGTSEKTSSEGAPASTALETGVRARRAFMLKQFIPNADWINKNVVANGKGTRATVGRVYGVVFKTDRKSNILPDGKTSESVVCTGVFSTVDYISGELSEASTAYFPTAYAEKLEGMFKMDKDLKMIEIDCDIGLEATGKTIPYEWVVTHFREGEEMATMKRLRGSRQKPAQILLTAGGQSA